MAFWDRWRAKKQELLSSVEFQARMALLEQAVQVRIYDHPRAIASKEAAGAVSVLLEAIKDVPAACVVIDSLAIVKYEQRGQSVVVTRTLTPFELRAVQRHQDLQQDPATFFNKLQDAVRLLDIESVHLERRDPPALAGGEVD
jgi:hypothetical protein